MPTNRTEFGTGGPDIITANAGEQLTAFGLGGNDTLTGAELRDRLFGGSGDDTLAGNAGRDILESILLPSSTIAQGYESYAILTAEGRLLTGIVVRQTPDWVVLRDSAGAECLELGQNIAYFGVQLGDIDAHAGWGGWPEIGEAAAELVHSAAPVAAPQVVEADADLEDALVEVADVVGFHATSDVSWTPPMHETLLSFAICVARSGWLLEMPLSRTPTTTPLPVVTAWASATLICGMSHWRP